LEFGWIDAKGFWVERAIGEAIHSLASPGIRGRSEMTWKY